MRRTVMASGADPEPSDHSVPKLPLFFSSLPPAVGSPEHSGIQTPPFYSTVSVPFRWEVQPGKPRPCTALVAIPNPYADDAPPKSLELPPRLLTVESRITKTSTTSPTTVLEGPYSSSFRLARDRPPRGGCSGRRSISCTGAEGCGQLSTIVISKQKQRKAIGFLGSWGQRRLKSKGGKKENAGGGSFVFSQSSADDSGDESGCTKVKMARVRRNGSFSSLSQAKSQFWAVVYEGLKQVFLWRRKKPKKDGLVI